MQSYLQYRNFGRRLRSQVENTELNHQSLDSENEKVNTDPPAIIDDNSDWNDSSLRISASFEDLDNANPRIELESHILERAETHHTIGTHLGISLAGINVRSRKTIEGKELGKVFVVGYESSEDPMNPHNWPFRKRILASVNIGIIALVVGLAASIDSVAIPQAAAEFGVSDVTEALATGLFLLGFGCGALIAGPLSETVGRNPVYFGSIFIYMMFIMGAGLSQNIGSQLICRFLAGFFGEAPFSAVGGSLADMWDPMQRLIAFPVFAIVAFIGPVLGPTIGGFIAESPLISWRWTEWITLIISGLLLLSILLSLPETYEPILLKWKASQLRQITGDNRYLAPSEIRRHSFSSRMLQALYRPFLMTIHEPTIILWTAYLTVIYMLLFGFFAGYSFIFGDTYHMSQGITGLMFVGMTVGLFLCSIPLTPLIYHWAKRELAATKISHPDQLHIRLAPEFRLWYAMLGAPAIPISLFWMGWTANPTISYWSPLLASVLFGYGFLCVYISTYQYLIDSYEIYAASALTMITLVRYVASAGMVEITIPMYKNLGVHYTLTILGCIAVVFTPVPYLFFRFGPWIRSKSKFAFGDD